MKRTLDGQYVFVPNASTTGNVPLTFSIMDRWGLQATSTVTVNVLGGAVDDAFAIDEDTTLNANIRTNDQFPGGQLPTVSLVGNAPAATQFLLGSDGALTFRPVANATGTVSFTYQLTGTGFSDVATVTITINPVNDAPIVNVDGRLDSYKVVSGTTLAVKAPAFW